MDSLKKEIDFEEASAPVARYETICTSLAAQTNEKMHVHEKKKVITLLDSRNNFI